MKYLQILLWLLVSTLSFAQSDTKAVRSTNCLSTNFEIVVTDPGRSNYVVRSGKTIAGLTNGFSSTNTSLTLTNTWLYTYSNGVFILLVNTNTGSSASGDYATNWIVLTGAVVAVTASTALQPANTNGWIVTSHAGFLTAGSNVSSLINDAGYTNNTVTNGLASISYVDNATQNLVKVSDWSASGDPIGFISESQWNLAFTNDNRTVYLSPINVGGASYYYQGTGKVTKTATTSIQISTNLGAHFVYFNDASGNLVDTMTPWSFSNAVQVATVFQGITTNGVTNGLIAGECHGIDYPWSVHEEIHNCIGTMFSSGFVSTFSTTDFSLSAGVTYDEDLKDSIPGTNLCRVFYFDGRNTLNFSEKTNVVFLTNGGANNILYNSGTATNIVPKGDYVAYWIFGCNIESDYIMSIMGQRTDTTLANAKNNNNLSSLVFGSLPSQEMRPLWRVIYHRANGTGTLVYDESLDLRRVSYIASGAGGTATDASTLNGQAGSYYLNMANHTNWSGALPDGTLNMNNQAITNINSIQQNATGVTNYFAGYVGIGTNSPSYPLDVFGGSNLCARFCNTNTGLRGIILQSAISTNGGSKLFFYKARGTIDSESVVVKNDIPLNILSCAWDGYTYVNSAAIYVSVADPIGSNSVPMYLRFYTGTNSSDAVERVRITQTGRVGIGTNTPVTTLDVNGASTFRGVMDYTGNNTTNGGITTTSNLLVNGTSGMAINQNSSTVTNYFAGRVGIGTNNPATTLDVNGTTTIRGTLDMQSNVISNQAAYATPYSLSGLTNTITLGGGTNYYYWAVTNNPSGLFIAKNSTTTVVSYATIDILRGTNTLSISTSNCIASGLGGVANLTNTANTVQTFLFRQSPVMTNIACFQLN